MTVTIVETGVAPDPLARAHGRYPAMMQRLFAEVAFDAATEIADVTAGDAIPAPASGRALVIMGSPAGVYEDHEWIAPLFEAIRAHTAAGRPVVGICFGHQAMAAALGGTVKKAETGWGVGVHTYEVMSRLAETRAVFGDAPPPRLACLVSHQDQITELPEGALRLGGSAFCPNGVVGYRGGEGMNGLSFQMHPEFTSDFASALLAARADRVPSHARALAEASFAHLTDRHLIGKAIARHLSRR